MSEQHWVYHSSLRMFEIHASNFVIPLFTTGNDQKNLVGHNFPFGKVEAVENAFPNSWFQLNAKFKVRKY